MDIKDIAKALSTEFRPGDPKHFRLGVWHDGDTLENSSIKISKDLDSGDAFIDILDKKGTGKGSISDIKKHKQTFNAVRKHLPPGDYGLRADHPTKAKKYIRDFLKEPGFNLSGEKGGAKVLNKKTGKLEHKQFDTLTMTVPKKKTLRPVTAAERAAGLPTTREEAIRRGITRYNPGDEKGERVIRNYGSKSHPDGQDQRADLRKANRGSENRRARLKQQEITRKDYREFAKKNGYSKVQADFLFDKEQARLKRLRKQKRTYQGAELHYEHFTPNASETYGGVEHSRNLGLLGDEPNMAKSDLMIKRTTAKKAGIPLSIDDAIRMDFEGVKPTPRRTARKLIEEDLTSRKALTARERNRLASKIDAPKTLKIGKTGVVKSGAKTGIRSGARTLGRVGRLFAPAAVGVGLSALTAMDVQAREQQAQESGHWLDKLQSNLAKAELAADVTGVVPNPVSEVTGFGAGASNLLIDAVRGGIKTHQRIRGRSGAKKAIEQREELPLRGLSASINN